MGGVTQHSMVGVGRDLTRLKCIVQKRWSRYCTAGSHSTEDVRDWSPVLTYTCTHKVHMRRPRRTPSS